MAITICACLVASCGETRWGGSAEDALGATEAASGPQLSEAEVASLEARAMNGDLGATETLAIWYESQENFIEGERHWLSLGEHEPCRVVTILIESMKMDIPLSQNALRFIAEANCSSSM